MNYQIPPPSSGNPSSRLLGAIVGIFVMVLLFYVGLMVFAAVAGLALLMFGIFYLRGWWIMRKLRRQQGTADAANSNRQPRPDSHSSEGVTLEGEFRESDRDD